MLVTEPDSGRERCADCGKLKPLTKAQQNMLDLAVTTMDGNPWRQIGIRRRAGGALWRMFEPMRKRGWFDYGNCITPMGRKAQAAK